MSKMDRREQNRILPKFLPMISSGEDPPEKMIELLKRDTRLSTARILYRGGRLLLRKNRYVAASGVFLAYIVVALRVAVMERKQTMACSVNDPLKLAKKLRPDGPFRLKREWYEKLTEAIVEADRDRPEMRARALMNLSHRLMSGNAFE
ncbi:hypothetical protein Pla123a_43910 [Posidoniimonas polymericola]|uniref:Uncharacterized protein n=1 Tax=Posidoniimonas polymericola TaxID=2528002 RepID=A0A5C5XZQ6_9BACT|nr:hypothetical protein [Posidoniimonas polymericola]TWT66962.1 hypothetical protein Pla123a_43910 [Posidoniimonas polymericola]